MLAAQGAARRRQRRLRQFLRHERLSVAIALAEALHHSYGLLTKKVVERREGPEGEVRETHDALRGQKRPLSGTRPAPLPVVAEPHGRPEAAARVSAGVPSLVPVALSSADEGVDAAALSFLLLRSLEVKRKEEEKAKEKEELVKAKEAVHAWHRRRQKALDEFMALLDLPRRTLESKRMREVGDLVDAMDAAGPPPSSASSLLVLLVTMQIALCSLWLSAGPGRARRRPRWQFLAGFAGDAAARFVPFFCRHVDVEVFSQHRVQPCFAAQIISFASFAGDDAFRAVLFSLSTRSWLRSSPTLSVACAWLGSLLSFTGP